MLRKSDAELIANEILCRDALSRIKHYVASPSR